jgi:hypothetical protein
MKGYPKVIATKQDFVNLLSIPEFREQALKDLQHLSNLSATGAIVKRAIQPKDAAKPDGEWLTEDIENPNPVWKQKGFSSLKELTDLVQKEAKLEAVNG